MTSRVKPGAGGRATAKELQPSSNWTIAVSPSSPPAASPPVGTTRTAPEGGLDSQTELSQAGPGASSIRNAFCRSPSSPGGVATAHPATANTSRDERPHRTDLIRAGNIRQRGTRSRVPHNRTDLDPESSQLHRGTPPALHPAPGVPPNTSNNPASYRHPLPPLRWGYPVDRTGPTTQCNRSTRLAGALPQRQQQAVQAG